MIGTTFISGEIDLALVSKEKRLEIKKIVSRT